MPGHSESDYAQPLALDSLYSQGSSGYVEPVALDSPYSQASPGYVQPVTMMPLYSEPQVSAQSSTDVYAKPVRNRKAGSGRSDAWRGTYTAPLAGPAGPAGSARESVFGFGGSDTA